MKGLTIRTARLLTLNASSCTHLSIPFLGTHVVTTEHSQPAPDPSSSAYVTSPHGSYRKLCFSDQSVGKCAVCKNSRRSRPADDALGFRKLAGVYRDDSDWYPPAHHQHVRHSRPFIISMPHTNLHRMVQSSGLLTACRLRWPVDVRS